jgi:glyoxylate reductase
MPQEGGFPMEEQLLYLKNADALLSLFNAPVTKEMLLKAPNLKLIANYGVGYNNIDLDFAKARRIKVSNTPDPVTWPTAEHTFALLLALSRSISELDRKLRKNQVDDWKVMSNLGRTLQGKTLGVIGIGKIGKKVSQMAKAFGMNSIYYSRTRLPENEENNYDIRYSTFDNLLWQADIVSLHVPLTTETTHLIGKKELALMKPTAYIVNTARGAVINQEALVHSLQQMQIAGAALDVFEDEPQIPPRLLAMDNVVLAPHTGTATVETRIEMAKDAAKNIIAFFNGEPLPNEVI